MSQVSKILLQKEHLNKVLSLLFTLIVNIQNKKSAEILLNELLTPTEKIMLAKRLACFYLLLKEIPIREIKDILKLSTSTIAYLKHFLENSSNLRSYLRDRMTKEEIKNIFEDFIVDMLYGIPRKGSNWSQNLKQYYDHQQKRKEPI